MAGQTGLETKLRVVTAREEESEWTDGPRLFTYTMKPKWMDGFSLFVSGPGLRGHSAIKIVWEGYFAPEGDSIGW